jgi:hypothetical protein
VTWPRSLAISNTEPSTPTRATNSSSPPMSMVTAGTALQ